MLNCCYNRINHSCNSTEVVMDIIYENFLNTFHREKQGTENEFVKFSDFFKIEESIFSEFDKKDISVTKLKVYNIKYIVRILQTNRIII